MNKKGVDETDYGDWGFVSYEDAVACNGNCLWWLRSPGRYQCYGAFVDYDGSLVFYYDFYVDYSAVRPAFWLNLESLIF